MRRCAGAIALTVSALAAAACLTGIAAPSVADGSVVKLVGNADTGYHLLFNGKPYFIKGAGGSGSKQMLADCGANSFRTWGSDNVVSDEAEAAAHGLTVTEGMWLGHTEQGFNWNDPDQIAKQREMVRKSVLAGRGGSSLLIWALGNEMEGYGAGDDPVIWNEVEHLAKMVKSLDPNHPTMTVISEIGSDKVATINRLCPDIDIIGINSYGGAPSLAARYKTVGGVKPYVITEFGPPGVWEMAKNSWGVYNEMTSTQKADAYRKAYVNSVRNQPLCLGSYAFTWGNKQEATSTWYGMLLPDGSKLAAVDALRDLWTGHPGTPNAPVIASFDVDADRVKPGALVHATLSVSDPQNDPLRVEYLLTADKERISPGGQVEPPQEGFENAVVSSSQTGADVRMPTDPGPYRLFVYIHDKHNESAVANIALDVTEKKTIVSDAPKADMPYDIYSNGQSSADYIPSGYMGNRDAIHMDAHCQTVQGHSGSECLQVRYTASDGWGGVVWQSPSNDWGDQDGGLNLTGAKKLLFWARGDRGGEKVTFDFGLIGDDKKYSDSDSGKLADVVLTQDWKQYSIDLADKDLSRIKTGFCWIVAGSGKPTTFYLDDIRYDGPSQAPAGGQAGSALSAHSDARKANLPYALYANGESAQDYVASGYMGNTGAVQMDMNSTAVGGHSGSQCIQVKYAAADNWAGVVWQSPANDWGDRRGGLDLTGARVLTFWARGDQGGETATFEYGLIGHDKKYPDSSSGKLADVKLSTIWKKYSISLANKDLSRIKTGFCWIVAGAGKPVTFYIDDITYE